MVTKAGLQVEPKMLFVRTTGAGAKADLPGQPEVEVLTYALLASVDMRALLDPVKQIDQRGLRLPLGGEAALTLPAALPLLAGDQLGLEVPAAVALRAKPRAGGTQRLAGRVDATTALEC